jgi:hypothetical protein
MIYSLLSFLQVRYEKFVMVVKCALVTHFSAETVLIFRSKSPMLCLFVAWTLRGRQTLSRNTLPRYTWTTPTILISLFFIQHNIIVVDDSSKEPISVSSRKTTPLLGHEILRQPAWCNPCLCTAIGAQKMCQRHTFASLKMSIRSHARLFPRSKSNISM